MSVLIKRMEMPKSCDKCELMTANYGCVFVGAVGGESYSKRAWDCPLVEVPEPMKWIPVTERLPEVRTWVLCYCRANSFDVFRMTDEGNWQYGNRSIYMKGYVTHWMPLPPAPKEE